MVSHRNPGGADPGRGCLSGADADVGGAQHLTGGLRRGGLVALVLVLSLLLACLQAPSLGARSSTPVGLPDPEETRGLVAMSPVIAQLEAPPGGTASYEAHVRNDSEESVRVRMAFDDAVPDLESQDGDMLYGEVETGEFRWFSAKPGDLLLEPGETAVVTVTVSIPGDADPGGHYVGVFAEVLPPPGSTAPIQVATRLGALAMVTVDGPVDERVSVSIEPTSRLVIGSSVDVRVLVENDGDLHRAIDADVVLDGIAGSERSAEIESRFVYPHTTRRVDHRFEVGLLPGLWTPRYLWNDARDGEDVQGQSVVVIPRWLAALALALAVALIVRAAVRRLRRDRRDLHAHEDWYGDER